MYCRPIYPCTNQCVLQVSSTSFANNITPTYWSASQLLSEHEIRKREQGPEGGREQGYPEMINYDPSSNYGYYPDQYNYSTDPYFEEYSR